MANRKSKLGKVISQIQGYRVRAIRETTREGKLLTNGYAVYAGKNPKSDLSNLFKNHTEAENFIRETLL